MQSAHPRYFTLGNKMYKIVKNGIVDEVSMLNEKNGMFEHVMGTRAFDIETTGIEVPAEEVLRKIR